MPSVTFTAAQPVVRQELTPPVGATALIVHFTVTAPPGAAQNVRLAHLRTLNSVLHPNLPAEGRLPRESEVVELKVRNGALTAEFSGKGGNRTTHPVVHMGPTPASFPVTLTVPFTGHAAVVAAGSLVATSDTDIAPNGQPLELLLGMEPILGADLQPPIGWTISWEDGAVEWPGAQVAPPLQPPVPPAPPPTPGPGPIDPQVGPTPPAPVPPASADPRAILFQALLQQLPPEEATILQPFIADLVAGKPINRQTLLLALLPLLFGRS